MLIYEAHATDTKSFPTLAAAHNWLNEATKDWVTIYLPEASITSHNVPTDKENILRLLNQEGGTHEPTGREWRLTPKRSLREVQRG